MAGRIEDYALIGDTRTAALVGRDGSIDWLCLPRFDSGACFAALLGTEDHGHWQIAPADTTARVRRRYCGDTLVLETTFETADGVARVTDFMVPEPTRERGDLVRIVDGISGTVAMDVELLLRFDYGRTVPWVTGQSTGLYAVAGPNAVELRTPAQMEWDPRGARARLTLRAGDRIPFVLTWHPSTVPRPRPLDALEALARTVAWWSAWRPRAEVGGRWHEAVRRSLVTLKGLTDRETGGIVAAATTSVPEAIGGSRNWDYRYCWIRDATFTLYAFHLAGLQAELEQWRSWLLRAIAGNPAQLQILYGLSGERLVPEFEINWLPGYEGSRPVRVGNAAHTQFQLDVPGEIMDAMHFCRRAAIRDGGDSWALERALLDFLDDAWREPDEGLWEIRGPRRHFTHSKVMAWVAFDRAIRAVERFGNAGPVEHWRARRAEIHDEVCARGFDAGRGTFVQAYGSEALDASLLMLPLVGFLPALDRRMQGTVAAIERELMHDGFVYRYRPDQDFDGLGGEEGTFLACSFWYVDNLALAGRQAEATTAFERILAVRNDVGLLAEQYDPVARRQLGNFPQAYSHVGLVNAAVNLAPGMATTLDRAAGGGAGGGA